MVTEVQASYKRDIEQAQALQAKETDLNTKAVLDKRIQVLEQRSEGVGKIGRILTNLQYQLALLEDTFGLINDQIRARSPEQVLADIEGVVDQTDSMTQLLEELAPYEQARLSRYLETRKGTRQMMDIAEKLRKAAGLFVELPAGHGRRGTRAMTPGRSRLPPRHAHRGADRPRVGGAEPGRDPGLARGRARLRDVRRPGRLRGDLRPGGPADRAVHRRADAGHAELAARRTAAGRCAGRR